MPQHTLLERLRGPFGDIFAGGTDPRLSPQQNQDVQKQAIIQAGLSTILGASQPGASALASIAGGGLAGREAGGQLRQQAVRRGGQQEIAGLLSQGGIDLPALREAMITSLKTGDIESMKVIGSVITSMQAAEGRQTATPNLTTVESFDSETGITSIFNRDPRTGELVGDAIAQKPPVARIRPERRLKEGVMHQVLVDERGVEVQDLGPVPDAGGEGGVQTRINANLATLMSEAENVLSTVDETLANPIVATLASIVRKGGVFGTAANIALRNVSPEGQLALAAGDQWVTAAVRLISGAQMTQQERQGYRSAYLPSGGDSDQVQAQKAEARALFSIMFQNGGASTEGLDLVLKEVGLPPVVVDEDASTDPFGDLIPRGR